MAEQGIVNECDDFSERLNEYLSDTSKRNSPIIVCDTPNALLAIGAKPLPIVINPNDIDKCLAERTANKNKNSHSLTIGELGALPKLLAEPVLIFKEPKTGYITIVTDRNDKEGRPLIIGVELECLQYKKKINRIASMYGRDRAIESFVAKNGKEVQGYIPRMIEMGQLLAINKEKAQIFFKSTGLQLPEGKEYLNLALTLTQPTVSVNSLETFEFPHFRASLGT